MNELLKIDFSTLSTGEQVQVKRISQKVEAGQDVTEKEKQFIRDMCSRVNGRKQDTKLAVYDHLNSTPMD